jgi:nucleotide-binding universal stress UspA family protein
VVALAEKHGVECEKLVIEGGGKDHRPCGTRDRPNYVVMGTEGTSRLESIMIGNVAQEVLGNAECTVLLVVRKRSPNDPMLSEPVCPNPSTEDQPS